MRRIRAGGPLRSRICVGRLDVRGEGARLPVDPVGSACRPPWLRSRRSPARSPTKGLGGAQGLHPVERGSLIEPSWACASLPRPRSRWSRIARRCPSRSRSPRQGGESLKKILYHRTGTAHGGAFMSGRGARCHSTTLVQLAHVRCEQEDRAPRRRGLEARGARTASP